MDKRNIATGPRQPADIHRRPSCSARMRRAPKHVTAAVNLDAIIATIAYAASYITDYRNRCCSNPPYRTLYSIENFAAAIRRASSTLILIKVPICQPCFKWRTAYYLKEEVEGGG